MPIEDDARVTEQAARWLGVLLDSNNRGAEFFAWLAESPRHVEELLFLLDDAQELVTISAERRARIESLSRELRPAAEAGANVVPISPIALRSYEGLMEVERNETRVGTLQSFDDGKPYSAGRSPATPAPKPDTRHRSRNPLRLGMNWTSIMAAVVLIAFGTVIWLPGPGAWDTYTTRVGEERALELPDGSVVQLNADSRISVRLTSTSRTIRLTRGEALFTVKHDPKRPFRVHSEDAIIQALGTQFDVHRQLKNTRVAVIEGLVRISSELSPAPSFLTQEVIHSHDASSVRPSTANGKRWARRPELLAAGEAADVSVQGEVSHKETVDTAKAVAWRQRRLVFEQETLQNIAEQFNRYNLTPKIRVLGAPATTEHFSGTFDADEPDTFARSLTVHPALSIERTESEIVIRERNAAQNPKESRSMVDCQTFEATRRLLCPHDPNASSPPSLTE